ncbi:hypothetical protein ANCCAN_01694 [Ancylostoma caninum]|uniref:SCP domain-containing protein n=1 Tax=Ancylostoma caninum TaxID=29170 RepID=A0A368H6M8_ANCCA|nr:hypothetical protein ANCCAN_01694 [Ancylostoma caninum]
MINLIILCLVRTALSTTANCPGAALTNDQRDKITHFHNQIRSTVANGVAPNWIGCLGGGANIYELRYDCALEAAAEAAMANACRQAMVTPAVHGQNVQAYVDDRFIDYLELNSYVSNKICALKLDDLIEDSIQQWYMPVYRYGLNDANNMYTDPRLESFANMAFYKNTAVGCHYAECPGHNSARKVITCMYDNVITPSDFIYQKGFPCRTNADCSFYTSSTCDLTTGLCGTTVRPQPNPQPNPNPTPCRVSVNFFFKFRSQLALGNIKNGKNSYNCPTASNMYKMKYDCELENLALAYAKQCTLVASNTPTEGENVHSAPYQPDQYAAAKAAVQAWWSQIFKNGLNQKMLFIANLRDKPNSPLGFTQVIDTRVMFLTSKSTKSDHLVPPARLHA